MKPSIRASLSLLTTGVAATISIPPMLELMREVVFPSPGIVEPWFFTGRFWEASLTLFACDLVRQVILRRLLPVRLLLEVALTATAWVNQRWWFFPYYEMFVVFAAYIGAYAFALVSDLKTISRSTATDGSPEEHTFLLTARPDLVWLGLACCSLLIGHASAFLFYIPLAFRHISDAGLMVLGRIKDPAYASDVNHLSGEISKGTEYIDRACVLNAVLLSVSALFFLLALYEAYKKPNPPERDASRQIGGRP
jgi:hypothetical protein